MRSAVAAPASLALAVALVLGAGTGRAHHVGSFAPRDNELSANFKQIKFSLQARRFDVALRLYDAGPIRAQMRADAARLPERLEAATRDALAAGDGPRAERGLMVFFAVLMRELAVEADRRLADASVPAAARLAAGQKFLEAIWRYYNLVDFVVTQNDAKAAVAFRLAFDEAEGIAPGADGGAGSSGAKASADARRAPTDAGAPSGPDRLREPLQRMARILSGLIETSTLAMR